MSPPKVFLSYAHEDVDAASRLYEELKLAGVDAWFDKKDLLPGKIWKAAIRQAIRDSRYFLAILSKNSVNKRGFVQKELMEALDMLDNFPQSEIFIIPVRLDDCEPSHERLREIQWVDMFPSWKNGLDKILTSIRSGDGRERQLQEADPKSAISRGSRSWVPDGDLTENYKVTIITQEGTTIHSPDPAFIDVAPNTNSSSQINFDIDEYRKYSELMHERCHIPHVRSHARDEIYKLLNANNYSMVEIDEIVNDLLGWLENPLDLTEDEILTMLIILCQNVSEAELLDEKNRNNIVTAVLEIAFDMIREYEGVSSDDYVARVDAFEIIKILDARYNWVIEKAEDFIYTVLRRGYDTGNYLFSVRDWLANDPQLKERLRKNAEKILIGTENRKIAGGCRSFMRGL